MAYQPLGKDDIPTELGVELGDLPGPSFIPSAPYLDEERELVVQSLPSMTQEEKSKAALLPLPLSRDHPGGKLSELVSEREHMEFVDTVNEVNEKESDGLEEVQNLFLKGMIALIVGYVVLGVIYCLPLGPIVADLVFGLLAIGLVLLFVLIFYRYYSMKKAAQKVLEFGNNFGKEKFLAR